MRASRVPALTDATYLPPNMTAEQASAYCLQHRDHAFVIFCTNQGQSISNSERRSEDDLANDKRCSHHADAGIGGANASGSSKALESADAAGFFLLHSAPSVGRDVTVPAGSVEIERWLLPEFRSRGLHRLAWPAMRELLLARGHRFLVGVTWESNTASQSSLLACGFERLGKSFWQAEGGSSENSSNSSGWCEVLLFDLHQEPRRSGA